MRIAYARVSTPEQSLDLQTDALKEAGYDHIFCDHGRSGVKDRPELRAALELAQEGDTFMVWRLDRVARSMKELLDIISGLNDRGVRFLSLNESFDVSSAFGELILHVLGAIAHFERSLIIERTKAGMNAAKKRGVKMGRKPVMNSDEVAEAYQLINHGSSIEDVAREYGIGKSTLYRYMSAI